MSVLDVHRFSSDKDMVTLDSGPSWLRVTASYWITLQWPSIWLRMKFSKYGLLMRPECSFHLLEMLIPFTKSFPEGFSVDSVLSHPSQVIHCSGYEKSSYVSLRNCTLLISPCDKLQGLMWTCRGWSVLMSLQLFCPKGKLLEGQQLLLIEDSRRL